MADRTCSVEGCESKHYGRGWCLKHYMRWFRTGDPGEAGYRPPPGKPHRWCSIEGCGKKHQGNGYCPMHNERWKKWGDPHQSTIDPEIHFWDRVSKTDTCWLWNASKSDGYGDLVWGGVHQGAHRVAYELLVGPIPDGLEIDHLCFVRNCVNPAHLEAVTQQENIRRMWARRRKAQNLYLKDG